MLQFAFLVKAADSGIPGFEETYAEPTVVVINSNKWQDAYLASIYANINNYPIRYIQDPFQTKDFMTELATNKYTKVILFNRKDSTVPSLIYLLHTQNLDVREVDFTDQFDLSTKMLERIPAQKVILVRDDFAFDSLTAKYLSQKLKAPVIYSKGAEDMDLGVLNALNQFNPAEIIMIGRPSTKLEATLSKFNLKKLQGRDEFDTNNIAIQYAIGDDKMVQGVLTTGDIYELALMNIQGQPYFLMPEFGTYSLIKTADMVKKAEIKTLLGIGRFVTEGGSFVKERAGTRLLVKFGTLRAYEQQEGMVKQDLSIRLEGYQLPLPQYNGKIVEINPSYTDPLGPATASMINQENKPAPPVDFVTVFENTGNIEFPAYIILTLVDQNNATIASLQSEKQMVYPKRPNVFHIKWTNPPAEGKYNVIGKVFGDVYEGLNLPGKDTDFELKWLYVYLNLLLLLIAMLILVMAIYSSHVLKKDIGLFGITYKKATEQIDGLVKYVTNVYHFRSKKRK
jgi:hypothetical protein